MLKFLGLIYFVLIKNVKSRGSPCRALVHSSQVGDSLTFFLRKKYIIPKISNLEMDFKMKDKEIERLNVLKEFENNLYKTGLNYIAGIDEAGRGPLAGPVVVGIVIMKPDSFIEGINDSKKISEKKREKLFDQITEEAIDWAVRNCRPE